MAAALAYGGSRDWFAPFKLEGRISGGCAPPTGLRLKVLWPKGATARRISWGIICQPRGFDASKNTRSSGVYAGLRIFHA